MKYAAHYLHNGSDWIFPKAWVEIDASGRVLRVEKPEGDLREQAGMEFHSGIICPAFPNLFNQLGLNEILRLIPALVPFAPDCPPDTADPRVMFNWLHRIQQNHPETDLGKLIGLFSLKASQVAGLRQAGSFEPGKYPGVWLLTGIDYTGLRLTAGSRRVKLAAPEY